MCAEIADVMLPDQLPSGNQKRFWRDIGVQLWMCCQSRCQLAFSDGCFTYESGGEGS